MDKAKLDEYITGMMHKSLVSDNTREAMRNRTIKPGDEYTVYIHKIENNRVILSDVPSSERDAVIARREAEDELEKVNVIPVRFTVLIQENVWPQVPRILVNQWMFFVEFLDSVVYNGLCSGSRNEKQEM